mmetsp:Transcript_28784/g.44740  ORF Transcript_28784/g.44740 Transcript_28784/m.44740 type:complete len:593 (-) Transcript_28784:769-2547(-)
MKTSPLQQQPVPDTKNHSTTITGGYESEEEDDGHRSICTVSTLGLSSVVGNSTSKQQDRAAAVTAANSNSNSNKSFSGGISISSRESSRSRRSLTKRSTVASLDDSLHSDDDCEDGELKIEANARPSNRLSMQQVNLPKTTLNADIKYVGRVGDVLIAPTSTHQGLSATSSISSSGAEIRNKNKHSVNVNVVRGNINTTTTKLPSKVQSVEEKQQLHSSSHSNKKKEKDEDLAAAALMVHPRRVRFRMVEVREYNRVIGDNPSVTTGPAISLGWSYNVADRVTINEYERTRKITGHVRPIRRIDREEMLRDLGFSRAEIADSVRGIVRTKNQRRQTYHNLKVARMEEAVESAVKTVKRVFRPRSAARRESEILNYGSGSSSASSIVAVAGSTHVLSTTTVASSRVSTTSSRSSNTSASSGTRLERQQNNAATQSGVMAGDAASGCSSNSSGSRNKARVVGLPKMLSRRRSSKDGNSSTVKAKGPLPKSSSHSSNHSSVSSGSRRGLFRSLSNVSHKKDVIEYELDRNMPMQKQSNTSASSMTGNATIAKTMVVLARSASTVVCEEPPDDDDVIVGAGVSDRTLPTCAVSLPN